MPLHKLWCERLEDGYMLHATRQPNSYAVLVDDQQKPGEYAGTPPLDERLPAHHMEGPSNGRHDVQDVRRGAPDIQAPVQGRRLEELRHDLQEPGPVREVRDRGRQALRAAARQTTLTTRSQLGGSALVVGPPGCPRKIANRPTG